MLKIISEPKEIDSILNTPLESIGGFISTNGEIVLLQDEHFIIIMEEKIIFVQEYLSIKECAPTLRDLIYVINQEYDDEMLFDRLIKRAEITVKIWE